MKVRNKEHQSLGLEQLQQLCDEFPNDQMLGEELRRITKAAASVNNPEGLRATSPSLEITPEELEAWHSMSREMRGSVHEDNPSDIERDYEDSNIS